MVFLLFTRSLLCCPLVYSSVNRFHSGPIKSIHKDFILTGYFSLTSVRSYMLYYATFYTPALSPQFHLVGRPFSGCLSCPLRPRCATRITMKNPRVFSPGVLLILMEFFCYLFIPSFGPQHFTFTASNHEPIQGRCGNRWF